MCANSCFYGSAVLNYFLGWIENKGLKSSPNWAWLAVLYSRLTFSAFYFKYLIKNPQTTIALTFLAHVISGLGGVPALNKYTVFCTIVLMLLYINFTTSQTRHNTLWSKCFWNCISILDNIFWWNINSIFFRGLYLYVDIE